MRIDVDDPLDPRIEVYQGLRDHVLRRRREGPGGDMAGVFVAEGDLVVERAVAAGYQLVSVLIDGKRTRSLPAAVGDDIPVFAAGPDVLQRITGYHLHRGMLACFVRKHVPDPAEILPSLRSIVVCEGVQNPTNLGVIIRCAAGLDIDGLLLDPTTADPLYRRAGRVSMGEAFKLPHARLPALPDGLDVIHEHGFTTLALTPADDSVDIGTLRFDPEERVAILLGSEGPGLSDETMAAVHHRVAIPMTGTVDSLNVGVAAGIAFFALRHARRAS